MKGHLYSQSACTGFLIILQRSLEHVSIGICRICNNIAVTDNDDK